MARPTQRLASAGAYPGRAVTVGTDQHASELANVVVFAKAGATPSPPMRAVIRQVDEQFAPHLVAITSGEPVGKSGGTNTLKIVRIGDHL